MTYCIQMPVVLRLQSGICLSYLIWVVTIQLLLQKNLVFFNHVIFFLFTKYKLIARSTWVSNTNHLNLTCFHESIINVICGWILFSEKIPICQPYLVHLMIVDVHVRVAWSKDIELFSWFISQCYVFFRRSDCWLQLATRHCIFCFWNHYKMNMNFT